jgi:hypothetical protein
VLLGNAHDVFIARCFIELATIEKYGVPEVFHHDAEFAHLLRVSTGGEVFSGVRMWQGDDVKNELIFLF